MTSSEAKNIIDNYFEKVYVDGCAYVKYDDVINLLNMVGTGVESIKTLYNFLDDNVING